MGAKAGLIAPDRITFDYIKGKAHAPEAQHWDAAVQYWQSLYSDADAVFDQLVEIDAATITPQITWGTNPEQVIAVDQSVPAPDSFSDATKREAAIRALAYMGLEPGQKLTDCKVDVVFIGSCTNSRIEDLRAAASVVPGAGVVKRQAEAEGLAGIFKDAGFEWREPGCSMCLGMNDDRVEAGQRCASTSNRNFEGRQGRGARTHLVSPAMAAAAAIAGKFVNIAAVNEQGDRA